MLKQIKVMGIATIIGLSLNLIGCESTQETTEVFDINNVTEIALREPANEYEFTKVDLQTNIDAIEECVEDDHIEIIGQVGVMQQQGTEGVMIQLDFECDDEWQGYPIEVSAMNEWIQELEKGDYIKVQGRYNGVHKWTLNQPGQNIGAHLISAYGLYKLEPIK